jgi:hypothetical protein
MKLNRLVWLLLVLLFAEPQVCVAADGTLSRAEVQQLIVGKRITHYVDEDTQASFAFAPNGTFT